MTYHPMFVLCIWMASSLWCEGRCIELALYDTFDFMCLILRKVEPKIYKAKLEAKVL